MASCYLQLWLTVLVVALRPYNSRVKNAHHIVNLLFVLLQSYGFFYFSDFFTDTDLAGYILIAINMVNIFLINLVPQVLTAVMEFLSYLWEKCVLTQRRQQKKYEKAMQKRMT